MEEKSLKETRKDFREWFFENGTDDLSDQELLEKIICLSCDKCDYKLATKSLFETYHTLDRILKAPVLQLMRVKNISKIVAVYIACIGALRQRMSENQNVSIVDFSDVNNRKIFAKNALRYLPQEHVIMLNLDKNQKLINKYDLAQGSITSCSVSPRDMAKYIVFDRPSYVMFAHNHPDGNAEPSSNDILFSQNTSKWLSGFGIGMVDHIIVSQSEIVSMRENNLSKLCVEWSS